MKIYKTHPLYFTLFTVLFSFCFVSCYEDKGNYKYEEINEISIIGIEKSYDILAGEGLTINPYIMSTMSDDYSRYSYEWILVKGSLVENGKQVTKNNVHWSDLKEWDNFYPNLPIGTYQFCYKVKDNETGVSWFSDTFNVNVISDISKGFFVLSDVDNTARIDFVSLFDGRFDLKLDILTKLGTEIPNLQDPISVFCMSDRNSPKMGAAPADGQYMVAISTKKGTYRLNPGDFTYDDLYDIRKNVIGVLPDEFYIKNVSGNGVSLLAMDNNNNLYASDYTYQVFWTAGAYTNSLSNGAYVPIAPIYANPSDAGAVVYDIVNKSFATKVGSRTYISYYATENETMFDNVLFKFNNTGKDLVFIKGRSREKDERDKIYCLLENPGTNELFLGKFSLAGKQEFYRKLDLPELNNAKEFLMSDASSTLSETLEFLYYYTDTNIYVYNMADTRSEIVYTAPTGTKISFASFVDIGDWADHMMIFTYDESKPSDNCGKMQVMKVKPAYGTLSLAEHDGKHMEWSGFGKVISADWKNK